MKIETTYNGGPREYDLGQRTVVIGPTGSGKTTLLASLGLLLTGEADDAIGRAQVAAGRDLALAMDEDQEGIVVKATGGTAGDGIEYRVARGKTPHKWDKADEWRHPVRKLRTILAHNPDNARREMAPLLLGDQPIELHRLLPAQIHDAVPATVTVEDLAGLIETTAKTATALNRERGDLESALQAQEQMLPIRPPETGLVAMARLAQEYEQAVHLHARLSGQIEVYSGEVRSAEAGLVALQQRAEALRAEYVQAQATAQVTTVSTPPKPELPTITLPAQPRPPFTADQERTVLAYARIFEFAQPGVCPVCRQPADTTAQAATVRQHVGAKEKYEADLAAHRAACAQIAAKVEADYEAALDSWRRACAEVREAAPGRTLEQIRADYDSTSADYSRVQARLVESKQQIAKVEALLRANAVPQADPRPAYAAARASEDLWMRFTAQRTELVQKQERAAKLDMVVIELRRVLDRVYHERTAAVVEGVSRWLPRGWKADLMLRAPNGTPVFRFGLRDPDGKLRSNPSGGQRMALYLALAVWLIQAERIPNVGPTIVMPAEERTFSPEWFGEIMRALADAPAQIVLCNVDHPKGYRGKGWTIIDLKPEDTAKGKTKPTPETPETPAPEAPQIPVQASAPAPAPAPVQASAPEPAPSALAGLPAELAAIFTPPN